MDAAPRHKPSLVKIDRRKPTALTFDFALTRKAFSLVARCTDENTAHEAVTALAEDLAAQFGCDRVCVGFVVRDDIEIVAVSQSVQYNKDAALLRHIAAAMEEARDQESSIQFPAVAKSDALIFSLAHENLAKINGECCICTVPLAHRRRVIGAITLERSKSDPFPPNSVQLLEIIATLIGPVLDLKRREEAWIGKKVALSALDAMRRLIGPNHFGAKLTVAFFAAITLFLSLYTTHFRITGVSTLEGSIERVVTAPVDGYIAESLARPGDTLEEGQLIARLDEKDLSLKQIQWQTELERLEKEYRSALARRDRTEVAIITTKKDQAQAQAALIEEELSRLRVTAPFRSVLLEGDLSESLGSPVQRGEVLFTLAPLAGYRIILRIDESDITYIAPGQTGHLVLSSFPGETFPLSVRAVTPVSIAESGSNYFRVEAILLEPDSRLKPGMRGIGKVYAGEKKLIWIITRKLTDWLQITFWEYVP